MDSLVLRASTEASRINAAPAARGFRGASASFGSDRRLAALMRSQILRRRLEKNDFKRFIAYVLGILGQVCATPRHRPDCMYGTY